MKENSKALYIISLLSIFILVISLIFAGYIYFSKQSNENIEEELEKYRLSLEKIDKEEQEKTKNYQELTEANKEFEIDFKAKYGFSPSDNYKEMLEKEISEYKNNQAAILEEVKENIKAYSKYYEGSYYGSEKADEIISKFSDLANSDNYDKYSDDLYKDLDIADFIDFAKSDGTIKYLNSKNSWSKYNNVLLFSTLLYSQDLNAIANDKYEGSINLNKISADINSLVNIYKTLEEAGINTRDLNSKNLLNLKAKNDELSKKYFENKGILEKLEEIGKNDEKFK